jgi:hypothetical protein
MRAAEKRILSTLHFCIAMALSLGLGILRAPSQTPPTAFPKLEIEVRDLRTGAPCPNASVYVLEFADAFTKRTLHDSFNLSGPTIRDRMRALCRMRQTDREGKLLIPMPLYEACILAESGADTGIFCWTQPNDPQPAVLYVRSSKPLTVRVVSESGETIPNCPIAIGYNDRRLPVEVTYTNENGIATIRDTHLLFDLVPVESMLLSYQGPPNFNQYIGPEPHLVVWAAVCGTSNYVKVYYRDPEPVERTVVVEAGDFIEILSETLSERIGKHGTQCEGCPKSKSLGRLRARRLVPWGLVSFDRDRHRTRTRRRLPGS